VLDELEERIPLIVDAGATQHGIESTIVTVRNGRIGILRRGPITAEQLSGFADVVSVARTHQIASPGQLPSHYAPKTPLRLIDNAEAFAPHKNKRVGLLTWSGGFPASARRFKKPTSTGFAAVRTLSDRGDLREAAANLFRYLRELDALGLDLIVAERIPSGGLGEAIMDRLERASQR
jgi:L-threonylcarbamoyladenylate synthase